MLRVLAGIAAFLLLATSGWFCAAGCGSVFILGPVERLLLAGWVSLGLGLVCLWYSLRSDDNEEE